MMIGAAYCIILLNDKVQQQVDESMSLQIMIIIHWGLVNLSQVWFIQMIYMQLVEWIAMRNLILYQLDKSIG